MAIEYLTLLMVLSAAAFVPSGTIPPSGNNHTAVLGLVVKQAKAEIPRPPGPPAPTLIIGMVLPAVTVVDPIASLAVE